MRLQRMIALSSQLSRRAAEKAILDGRVKVGILVVTQLGTIVDPKIDDVFLDGKQISIPKNKIYIAYNKPKGLMVTKSDPEGRPTIWRDLGEWKGRVNAAGRLDMNSEGLLILSNDGDFINLLTHPSHMLWKAYRVWVRCSPTERSLDMLRNGIELEDGKTLPARVKLLHRDDNNSLLEICIREGRKRQVRRMCDTIDCSVRSLQRIAVGNIKLGLLKSGNWRPLKQLEINSIFKISKSKNSSKGRKGR